MKTTRALADLGQSLWLDNITRPLLDSGTLARYIDELDVTGLTSNPTIYDRAIGGTDAYDAEIAEAAHAGKTGEDTFFEVALSDLRRAADLFRPVHDRTDGVDGFVSLEVSAAPRLRRRGHRRPGEAPPRAGRPAEPVHQDPGHARGPAGRRGGDRLPGCRSTSRCCSARPSTSPARRPTPGASSAASRPACPRTWRRSRRCSSAAGTRRPRSSSRATCRTSWASPSGASRTPSTSRSSRPSAGSGSWPRAPARSACCSPAPGPRTRRCRPRCTSRAWPPRTPSTRCPRRRSWPPARAEEAVTGLDAEAPDQLARFAAAGLDIDAIAGELQRKGAESFVGSWTSLLDRIAAKVAAVA